MVFVNDKCLINVDFIEDWECVSFLSCYGGGDNFFYGFFIFIWVKKENNWIKKKVIGESELKV